jgi:hypothetical protein
VTLNIYAREMQRRDGEPERLRALVEGRDWTAIGQRLGSSDASTGAEGAVEAPSGHEKSPR